MKAITKFITLLAGYLLIANINVNAENAETNADALEKGKQIAFDRRKGNCLACHYVQGGTLMGTTGPGLIAMKQRFPERQTLVEQISDARIKNKNTIMPPFGAHGILTDQEITLVVDWLYTL